MDKEYVEKIKKNNSWFWDEDKKYYLVATDDLDSLLSCLLILKYRPLWEIGGFLDYRDGLYHRVDKDIELNEDNTIWVDCSVPRQGVKCISNHLTSISGEIHNTNDINLNSIDGNYRDKHYFSKYNLSTFLLLVSLLEHEIDNKPGRILSLCFDGAYKGYYQPSGYADKKVQRRYLLEVLKLYEIYAEQYEMDKKDFDYIVRDQNLHSKIFVSDEGIRCEDYVDLEMICKYLCINTNLSVLDGLYGMIKEVATKCETVEFMRDKDMQHDRLNSFAIVSKNNCVYSYYAN